MDWRNLLKHFWVDPRKHPDFAWVWITRALVTMGMWTVQPFLLYYLRDVIRVANPEETVGKMLGMVLIGATFTGLLGGYLSDRIGRKRVVYFANGMIAVIAVGFLFAHSLTAVYLLGILYGLGYGAYYSVDWALGCDVLPNKEDTAKDMGVWHIAMVLPQSIAPSIAGLLLANIGLVTKDAEGKILHYGMSGYVAIFVLAAGFLLLGAVLLRNVKGVH
jgi:MFS family permease